MFEKLPENNKNESNSILKKLRNLRLAIPLAATMFFANCENPTERSETIKKALEFNPDRVEQIDPEILSQAKETFIKLKEKTGQIAFKVDNSFDAYAIDDSTLGIIKVPTQNDPNEINNGIGVYEYLFSKDGVTKLTWSADNRGAILSGEILSALSAKGEIIVDNKTGVILSFNLFDVDSHVEPEYSIGSGGYVTYGSTGMGKVPGKVTYTKGIAKNFLNEHISDIDLINKELEKGE